VPAGREIWVCGGGQPRRLPTPHGFQPAV